MTNLDTTPPVAPETRASRRGENVVAGEAIAPEATTGEETTTEAAATAMKRRKRKIASLVSLLVILALLFAWYLINRKPLSELPGLAGDKLPHYQSSIYGSTHPLGVASNAAGDRIYVTESDGQRAVKIYDHSGKQTGTLTPPAASGKGHIPMYVAINPMTQDVYVSDRFTSAIYVYNEQGTYVRTFAPKEKAVGKWNPLGLAFAPDGSLYATDVQGKDSKTHRVLRFTPAGALVRSLGAPGQLSFPNGIVVDSYGNIEVSDSNNGRLVVFSPDGKMLATISRGVGEGDLGLPRGAAIDDAGRLFVADTSDHMVRMYTIDKGKPMPTYVGSFGSEGQLDGTFEYPNGVATDKRAHVYITDRENNRVQVWGY
jgi:DNA-binding beta-propeller fold protein YncE